jgi:polyhydroxybutyrate depolymerase
MSCSPRQPLPRATAWASTRRAPSWIVRRAGRPSLAVLACLAATWLILAPAAAATTTTTPNPTAAHLSPPPGTVVSTHAMVVDGRTRTWLEVAPSHASATIPILLVLHGVGATPAGEAERDGLLPLASTGSAELIYPAGVDRSWDAGTCCGQAAALHVDDLGFIERLAAEVDPGKHRPLDLVGYSDGGRMAYDVACHDPSIFTSLAVVDAVPQAGCAVAKPITVAQIDGTADKEVPYAPGDKGLETPPVTVQVSRLRSVDDCSATASTTTIGTLRLQTWGSCADGTKVELASFVGLGHEWFEGTAVTPSEGSVIWSFFDGKKPAL